MGVDLDETLYALDSTTIDLCLTLFPWARFRRHKAAVKMHTLLDLRGAIPTFIRITEGKLHDVHFLDELILEAGAFYVMDRGYLDYGRLYRFVLENAFFVTRAKSNIDCRWAASRPVDRATGLRADQTVYLQGTQAALDYPVLGSSDVGSVWLPQPSGGRPTTFCLKLERRKGLGQTAAQPEAGATPA